MWEPRDRMGCRCPKQVAAGALSPDCDPVGTACHFELLQLVRRAFGKSRRPIVEELAISDASDNGFHGLPHISAPVLGGLDAGTQFWGGVPGGSKFGATHQFDLTGCSERQQLTIPAPNGSGIIGSAHSERPRSPSWRAEKNH